MQKLVFGLLLLLNISSCTDKKKIPDVSNIKVQLNVQRFERDFFDIDTNNISASLNHLEQKYPAFLKDYLYNILALPPLEDSVVTLVKSFIRDYKPVNDSVQKRFSSIKETEKEVTKGLHFVKYYFPEYKEPERLITFVGPLEGYGNVLTGSGFAVGLQLYLGKNFSIYKSDYISEVYPEYQSRRFESGYIPVNCMKNVIDDIYPPKPSSQPLIEQMVELGKRLYILDALLPETADTLKTGYTSNQLQGCYENEGLIWNFFIKNGLLYITDPIQTRDYINDAPRTEALGEASPGNIGQFIGWQIVKKWMAESEERTLKDLIQTSARQIFEEAKYKPR
jgi:hypothetical protein